MKKIFVILSAAVLTLPSCLKDKPNTDFSGITPIAELTTASTAGTVQEPVSGLAFWSGASVSLPASGLDTVTFTANIASDYPLTVSTPITLAVDTTKVSYFNTSGTSTTTYSVMPASAYSFPVTTGTIPAGQRLDTFMVIFNTAAMPSTGSYMLPISITNAGNVEISGNLSTIYFHVN